MLKPEPEYPEVHIIAQPCWHEDAFIVGTRAGLTVLRDTISRALLAADGRAECELVPRDGEYYGAIVHVRDTLDDVPFGYTDEFARNTIPWPEWLR